MATNVLLPQWGMEMAEGTIVKWLKQEGDPIEEGELLVAVETAKLETEMESIATGVLAHILVPEGATVPIRTVLAVIAEPGEDVPRPETAPFSPSSGAVVAAPPPQPAAATAPQPRSVSEGEGRLNVQVVPAARRLAQQNGIDLADVQGTGPNGRILDRRRGAGHRGPSPAGRPGRPAAGYAPHHSDPHDAKPANHGASDPHHRGRRNRRHDC